MKDLLDYLGKCFLAFVVILFVLNIIAALGASTTPSYSSDSSSYRRSTYSSGSSYSGSSYSSSSGYKKKATPTPVPSYKQKTTGSSKKSSSGKSSYSYKDPDDYMDVEGFYYDNRSDFESEDDAWDYLEDEWDEWD